jgi:GTP-binding protein EngB required for normal cell division
MNPGLHTPPDVAATDRKSASETWGSGPASSLHDYLKKKLRITEVVQAILHQARQGGDDLIEAECRRLLSRLASDRFNLVVVGQFNRGKSTLMNAILGIDCLPTGVLPLTSVITSVGYGDRECVLLHRGGDRLPIEVSLAQLAENVTEAGNPGNRKGIAIAEVLLPVELLRLGFHFVDTPGVGSAIAENTRTTRAFLPEADASIFVTSFDSPLDEREIDLLAEVLDHVRQVFVVINKADTVLQEQKDAAISFVRSRLPERLAASQSALFPISALQAMRSRMEGDARGLGESGILELESALVRFLRVEKSRAFLLRIADRTEDLLRKQEEAVRLSEHTVSFPEGRADLAVWLRRRADALKSELQGLMDQARVRSVVAIRRRLEPELDSWSQHLAETLLERARAWLLCASFDDLLGDGEVLASGISNTCRDLTAAWLAERHRTLAHDLETELHRAGPLIDHVLAEANNMAAGPLDTIGPAVRKTATPWTPHVGDSALLPVPPGLAWRPGLLVCLWMVPAPLIRRVILKRLSRCLRASLVNYGCRLLERFDGAVESLIERQRNTLSAQIDGELSRLLHALQDEHIDDREGALDHLRQRLEAWRTEVEAISPEELDTMREEHMAGPSSVQGDCFQDAHASCAICQRVVAALSEYMSAKQYALGVNAIDQRQHALGSGFCATHTWYYDTMASPQGICLAYPPLLDLMASRLRTLANSAASSHSLMDGVAELLPTSAKCSACQLVAAVEKTAAKEIVGRIAEAAPGDSDSLPPLCLVHLYAVLNTKPPEDQARSLVRIQARVLEQIAEDMRMYALKHDAIRRELVTNKERRAYRTALLRLVGQRNAGKGAP